MPGAERCWLLLPFMFPFRVVIVFFVKSPLEIEPDTA